MKQNPLIRSPYLRPPDRSVIALFGALASLLLHTLLFIPVLLGAPTHHSNLSNAQKLTASTNSSEDSSLSLVFIEEPETGAAGARSADYLTSLLPSPSALLVPVAMPDLPTAAGMAQLNDQKDDEETVDGGANSDPGRAMMFGRYVGQINARVQRAWIRPRTTIDSGVFSCSARIVQDRRGNVLEVELGACNGDVRWQTSLALAIQSASPLPAPPDQSVFSDTLTLNFYALPFVSGGVSEGFEPAPCDVTSHCEVSQADLAR
jgi:hypothetical protein